MEKDISTILKRAVDENASDIFIIAGTSLCFKIQGVIRKIYPDVLTPADTLAYIDQIYKMRKDNHNDYIVSGEDDFSFSMNMVGRFRANIFYQRGSISAVLRVVKFELPDPIALKIPEAVLDLHKLNKGLVLVTGSAGSGKSTTLACLIDLINKQRNNHIITIEDPIEFLHRHQQSIVSQREIGSDTRDYADALKAALREAPNVILIGEMRDLETIQIALSAAETGHLIFSTLHTMSAAETINRIIDVFPASSKHQIAVQLSSSLKAIVCQQLVQGREGMLPAFEILRTNKAISTMIREEKIQQIDNAIQAGKDEGMIALDDYLLDLYNNGSISLEAMLDSANNPEMIKKRMNKH